MIIDCHSHWLPDEIIRNAHFFSPSWGDIEAQLKKMDEAGIDQAVLSYPTSDAHRALGSISQVARIFNDAVAAIIRRFPERFIGAAVLPVDNAASLSQELLRSTQELGFRALSLATSYNGMYLDDTLFLPVYESARRMKLPVFVHPQIVNPIGFERVQDPLLTPVIEYVFDTTISIGKLLMSGILRDYGDVAFVFSHFGGALPFLQHRFDATYEMLRGIDFVEDLGDRPSRYLKSIYVDTGGDPVKANFLLALELFGPGHILWGSDWPAKKDIAAALETVRGLDITEEDKANILGGNIERLLRGSAPLRNTPPRC